MPLLFFIDKDILDDPMCRDVSDVVLSYTFFRYDLLAPHLAFTDGILSKGEKERVWALRTRCR
jgi:cytochrome c oxidase assembly protein Cox11